MFGRKPKPQIETDVLVIGSGGAGLVAALAAHQAGAKVVLVEKAAKAGGTTAVAGGGSLDPGLFDTKTLGAWKDKLRRSPVFGMTAMSVSEATEWGVFSKPLKLPFKLLGQRFSEGLVCYGGALVGGLLKALLDRK